MTIVSTSVDTRTHTFATHTVMADNMCFGGSVQRYNILSLKNVFVRVTLKLMISSLNHLLLPIVCFLSF